MCTLASSACVCSDMWHTVLRTCQSVYFSLFGCVCVFFPPSFVLFGLSVTAVKRIPVPTAGRGSHSLNQPTRLHAHVLTCVNPCLCVSMWRWVVDASIHSGCHPSPSPIPHMSYDLSKNDERSPRVFFPLRPPPRSIQTLDLFCRRFLDVLQVHALCI